jgi:hypothetical protein
MANIAVTLKALGQERSRLAEQVQKMDKAIDVLRNLARGSVRGGKRRTMSAAARRRIAAAQRARWAKRKQEQKKAA